MCRWYEGDAKDEEDVFDPGKGNVLFCSAVDAWGFTVPQFGHIYASKFGFSPSALARALWVPYTLVKAAKSGAAPGKGPKIVPLSKAPAGALPMFAQLVLGPLWAAYEAVEPWNDGPGILAKIVRSQGLTVPDKVIATAGRAGVQVGPLSDTHAVHAYAHSSAANRAQSCHCALRWHALCAAGCDVRMASAG